MKSDAERGRYGRWLVRARLERRWSQRRAREALAAAGIHIAPSVYAEYESGTKKPSRTDEPRLVMFWGPIPDEGEGEAPEDLASAIRVQADSISELAAALRDRDALMTELLQALAVVQAEQSNQVATNSATIESLRVVLGRLVERDDPAAPTPATRRGTGG